jgi:hypothetical protein
MTIAPDAVVVSTDSMRSKDATEVIDSSVSFVNALFDELLTSDEIARDALRSYYVDYFYAQVMNGGFSQFIYNSRWAGEPIALLREGLRAMNAARQLREFERGAKVVEGCSQHYLDTYFDGDYFGDNPIRDAFEDSVRSDLADGLRELNAAWLRGRPNLVALSIAEMEAEVGRRGAALPDREERIARARANEPHELKLMRKLCERAGQKFDRHTAAALRNYRGERMWAYYFVTDRGPYYMLDLGTKAMMFPTDRADHVDEATLVAEVDV